MNRPVEHGTTVSTGGDVSRYQRRTKPRTSTDKPVDTGPKVRVSRGNNTSEVSIGKAGTALKQEQAQNVQAGGRVVPIAGATVIR